MRSRTIEYLKKSKAMKIIQHPIETDLQTFLTATLNLCRNNVVKRDIKSALHQLNAAAPYKFSYLG